MDIPRIIQEQKQYFLSGETKPLSFRIHQLTKLKQAIQKYEHEILFALKKDLNKSEKDAYMTEIGVLLEEISFMIKHAKSWVKPERVKTPVTHFGSKSVIYKEPYGTVLIIAPWNYPFQLAISPLIGAIIAGNTAVIKPSELTPTVSKLLKRIVAETFPPTYITVVEGAVETSQALLKENFDYIFFTGSVPVGRIVMEAAAQNLTPVTLELGGKSPVIVDESANLDLAARRIVWGKFLNAGQTCIAPDYLFVHEKVKQPLLDKMSDYIEKFYGKNPLENDDYTRIVSKRHFDRLVSFLSNGSVVIGGTYNEETLTIAPTVLDHISWDDAVMEDEIFGPILPVLTFQQIDECIEAIRNRPKPLALYTFTANEAIQQRIIHETSFGGGAMNDTILHIATPYLPFGGVGNSGIGSYHGKKSFDTFTHHKSVLHQTTKFDLPVRYPDFKDGLKWIKRLMK